MKRALLIIVLHFFSFTILWADGKKEVPSTNKAGAPAGRDKTTAVVPVKVGNAVHQAGQVREFKQFDSYSETSDQIAFDTQGIEKFILYKAKEGEPITIHKTLSPDTKPYTDKALIINTKYTYKIKAQYKDGSSSLLSKSIIINY